MGNNREEAEINLDEAYTSNVKTTHELKEIEALARNEYGMDLDEEYKDNSDRGDR